VRVVQSDRRQGRVWQVRRELLEGCSRLRVFRGEVDGACEHGDGSLSFAHRAELQRRRHGCIAHEVKVEAFGSEPVEVCERQAQQLLGGGGVLEAPVAGVFHFGEDDLLEGWGQRSLSHALLECLAARGRVEARAAVLRIEADGSCLASAVCLGWLDGFEADASSEHESLEVLQVFVGERSDRVQLRVLAAELRDARRLQVAKHLSHLVRYRVQGRPVRVQVEVVQVGRPREPLDSPLARLRTLRCVDEDWDFAGIGQLFYELGAADPLQCPLHRQHPHPQTCSLFSITRCEVQHDAVSLHESAVCEPLLVFH